MYNKLKMDGMMLIELILVNNDYGTFLHWLTLKNVNRECHKLFNSYLTKFFSIINNKLAIKVGVQVSNKIFETGHCLTGGFLLGCIYDQDYNSDVDILIKSEIVKIDYNGYDPFNQFYNCLYDNLYYQQDSGCGKSQVMHMYPDNFHHRRFFINKDFLISGKNFEYKEYDTYEDMRNAGTIIDHIIFNDHESVIDFIRNTYDLSFCKIAYDGKKLFIDDTNSIIFKKAYIEIVGDNPISCYSYSNKDRLQKSISINTSGCSNDFMSYGKLHQRIEKYRNRGFKIDIFKKDEL